jgi:hypothetical protein
VTRRSKVWILVAALVGTQGALVAWAATNSTSASDGGATVNVGVTSVATTPGQSVHRTGGGGGTSGAPCTYTPMPAKEAATFGPGGPTPGEWFFIHCPDRNLTIYNGALSWIPAGSPVSGGPPSTPPGALARQAVDSLTLPSPVINLNPSSFSVVNLSSWLWIDPSSWHSFRATATAGGVTATATAVPEAVTWSMGDGHSVVCNGPGTPYQAAISANAQSTNCSYTYVRSSAGEPSPGDPNNAAFTVVSTISWSVTWSATGAEGGGALPTLRTSSTAHVRVEQVESIGTAG